MISVIIPVMNSGRFLELTVQSLLNSTNFIEEIILIESESTDGTDKICDKLSIKPKVRVYHTKREGITKAINYGISQANPQNDIFLTQDDVIFPKMFERDWLELFHKVAEEKNVGLLTTLNGSGLSGPSYLDNFEWFGTWALYIPRKTIIRVGILDEEFSPGPGDDIDYSYRVQKADLIRLKLDYWVDHHRKTENFNDHLEEIKQRNSKYFKKKHGIQI